jgi:hypothetical protein
MSRILDWIERENVRHDEILQSRASGWLVARTLFGVFLTARAVSIALHATTGSRYALAVLLAAAGVAFMYDGTQILYTRVRGSR